MAHRASPVPYFIRGGKPHESNRATYSIYCIIRISPRRMTSVSRPTPADCACAQCWRPEFLQEARRDRLSTRHPFHVRHGREGNGDASPQKKGSRRGTGGLTRGVQLVNGNGRHACKKRQIWRRRGPKHTRHLTCRNVTIRQPPRQQCRTACVPAHRAYRHRPLYSEGRGAGISTVRRGSPDGPLGGRWHAWRWKHHRPSCDRPPRRGGKAADRPP